MTTPAIPNVVPATAVADFVHYLCRGEDPHNTIAADAVGNFNFPHTTFTVNSRDDLDELRERVSEHPWVARVNRVESTPDGFVLVADFDTVQGDGSLQTNRTITLVTVDEHRITEFMHWCTGAL